MITDTHDIDAIEQRRSDLEAEYQAAWHVHNDSINALPADAALRDMDDRRDRAAELTRDARAEQERIAGELISTAHDALDWVEGVLDSGDYSDGLDGMDRESLTRVFDRAMMRGDKARAIAAAQLLDADGDTTALPRLRANYDDVRVAMDYLDAYGDDPTSAVLAPLPHVRMPSDERIRPSVEVAHQHARDDAKRRAAEEAARLEVRQARQAVMQGPVWTGMLVSDEARTRRIAASRRDPRGRR